MASPREDRYADTLPPPGWKPKSSFFKAIWAKAEFSFHHKRLTLVCPHCGQDILMSITLLDNDPTSN